MAQTIIRNLCRYPLYLNLPRGRGVKLRARGTAAVEDGDLQCPAIIFHRGRGNVVILEQSLGQPTQWERSVPFPFGLQPGELPGAMAATPLKEAERPRAKAAKAK